MAEEGLRRVLVTGGAGYIGSHIVLTLLLTRRYKVLSIDNSHNSYPEALKRACEIAKDELPADASEQDRDSAEIDIFTGDLTKPADVRRVFDKYGKGGIWGVIHVAAYKAVGESSEIPLTYYANNVSATVLLAQTMSEYDCTKMVYSSSATVYGTPPIIPIPESTPLKADSVYGRTKVIPAGAHPSGRMGEDPKGRPGNLLPLLSQMAIGRVKDAELKVFGNDYPTHDGTCVRDYLHVMDLAAGHLLALDALENINHVAFANLPDRAKYKAYNLGRGKGQSVFDIVNAMKRATGKDFKTRVIERRLGDVPDLTADPALAEKELGFHASQDLETMCRDLWNWQTKNPEGYSTSVVPDATSPTVSSTTNDWVKVTPEKDKQPPLSASGGSLTVEAPTIPTEKAIFDPSTPAHISPLGSPNPPLRMSTINGISTPTNLELGKPVVPEDKSGAQKELKPEDVFIEQKYASTS
ncbi:UDP-glucose-4-epimerase [Tulasnella sp. 408]|nr:UDP-glucose-4-epimerase [Tulasnella sp. 408]